MPPRRPDSKPKDRLALSEEQIEAAARSAVYVGSPEHKRSPSFVSSIRPIQGNSICPPALSTDRNQLTEWVRQAIRNRWIAAPLEGIYPRYIWYRDGDDWFQGRLTNQGLGEYKGWPIAKDQLPDWWNE